MARNWTGITGVWAGPRADISIHIICGRVHAPVRRDAGGRVEPAEEAAELGCEAGAAQPPRQPGQLVGVPAGGPPNNNAVSRPAGGPPNNNAVSRPSAVDLGCRCLMRAAPSSTPASVRPARESRAQNTEEAASLLSHQPMHGTPYSMR